MGVDAKAPTGVVRRNVAWVAQWAAARTLGDAETALIRPRAAAWLRANP